MRKSGRRSLRGSFSREGNAFSDDENSVQARAKSHGRPESPRRVLSDASSAANKRRRTLEDGHAIVESILRGLHSSDENSPHEKTGRRRETAAPLTIESLLGSPLNDSLSSVGLGKLVDGDESRNIDFDELQGRRLTAEPADISALLNDLHRDESGDVSAASGNLYLFSV